MREEGGDVYNSDHGIKQKTFFVTSRFDSLRETFEKVLRFISAVDELLTPRIRRRGGSFFFGKALSNNFRAARRSTTALELCLRMAELNIAEFVRIF